MQARFLTSAQANAMQTADALVVRPNTFVATFIGLPLLVLLIAAISAVPWLVSAADGSVKEIPLSSVVMTALLLGFVLFSHLRYIMQQRKPDSWLFSISASQLLVRLHPVLGAAYQDPRFAVLAIDRKAVAAIEPRRRPLVTSKNDSQAARRLVFTFTEPLADEIRSVLQQQSRHVLLSVVRRWLPIPGLLQILETMPAEISFFNFRINGNGHQLELRLPATSPSWGKLCTMIAERRI